MYDIANTFLRDQVKFLIEENKRLLEKNESVKSIARKLQKQVEVRDELIKVQKEAYDELYKVNFYNSMEVMDVVQKGIDDLRTALR